MKLRSASRSLLFLLATCLLATLPGATWSIVAINRVTGEICVASATCLPRTDLTLLVPVIVVGRGGGVTQSVLDMGENRARIREGFLAGETPQEIFARIAELDPGLNTRQIGIVDFGGTPLSFTGSGAGAARKSITGTVGDIDYAIQGNVLAGREVVIECEDALRTSTGDLAQRVLAAMVRAREFGGDGRCSCTLGAPDSCGSPPADFTKSAHCGFLLLARMGDLDGTCERGEGCANGDYWMRLNIKGANALHDDPDPVDQLVERHALWRAQRSGRPDGLLSRAATVDSLPADGRTLRQLRLQLVDPDGVPLTRGGAQLELRGADGGSTRVQPGAVVDNGDGSYTVELRAGDVPGVDRLAITVQDDLVRATLYPYLELRSDPVRPLHVGYDRVSASAPASVPFVVDVPERPRARYWLMASLSGGRLHPGFDPGLFQLLPATAPFFPGPPAELDATGRGEALLELPAGALLPLVGLGIEWRAHIVGRGPPLRSNPVRVDVVP